MSFDNCLNCPLSGRSIAIALAIVTTILALGAFLSRRPFGVAKFVGLLFLITSVLSYLLTSFSILHYGVDWRMSQSTGLVETDRPADVSLLLAWYVVSIGLLLAVWRKWRRA